MSLFRSLFAFGKKEIADFFEHCSPRRAIRGLKLLVEPHQELEDLAEHGKLLIIVPKLYGNAPKRNRIRRQTKAIYFQEKLYDSARYRAALIVYPEARKLSFDDLKKFLVSALS